jgi:hypothetical protein
MALLRIDWKPAPRKVREFGLILLALSAVAAWRGSRLAPAGLVLGALATALPGSAGLRIYKAWMGVAFVVGSVVSPLILGAVFYGLVTPLGLVMRLLGRDALRLKRPEGPSYWTDMAMPDDKSYYERLF